MTTTPAATSTHIPLMQPLPKGSFQMGALNHDKFANILEQPRHTVTINAKFALAATPVTTTQWQYFQKHTNHPNPGLNQPHWPKNAPITGISHHDALDYIHWLSQHTKQTYHLPSEALWEFACRAGTQTIFHTGDNLTPHQANFLYDEQGNTVANPHPTPVQSFPPNPFGLFDMHANVAEHVADHWFPTYENAPADHAPRRIPNAPANTPTVIRGGAWDLLPRLCRASYRDPIHPDARLDNIGLRVALTLT